MLSSVNYKKGSNVIIYVSVMCHNVSPHVSVTSKVNCTLLCCYD